MARKVDELRGKMSRESRERSAAKTQRMIHEMAVVFEKTDTGYSAHVPDLPGCVAAGTTMEETAELMRKAIEMHVAGMREDRDSQAG